MFESIQFEVQGQVGILTLNRPQKLNAFTAQMNREVTQAVQKVRKNDDIRALVITGAGKAFSAGEDLANVTGNQEVEHGEILRKRYNPMMMAICELEKPVIAAVNGTAAGSGCSLALACDFRIVSSKASFLEAFVHIGLVPDSGSCYFLPRLVGLGKALELAILGEKISAEKAQELGLVTKLSTPEKLHEEALSFARKLARMPTKAIGLIKRTFATSLDSTLSATLDYEAYAQDIAGKTIDHQEGVAAFLEKREPHFQGK